MPTFDKWLIHRCDIEAGSASQNAIGEEEYSWSIAAGGGTVPCRLMERSETDPGEQVGELYVQLFTLLLGSSVSVQRQDYRINNVTDADGNALPESGPFTIEAIERRRDLGGVRLQALSVELID